MEGSVSTILRLWSVFVGLHVNPAYRAYTVSWLTVMYSSGRGGSENPCTHMDTVRRDPAGCRHCVCGLDPLCKYHDAGGIYSWLVCSFALVVVDGVLVADTTRSQWSSQEKKRDRK